MKIAVYCTGGTNLGFGHFFRSRAFAKAAPGTVSVRLFPVIEPDDAHFFKETAAITRVCHDEDEALAAIIDFMPDVMVVDTVHSSEGFVLSLKSRINTMVSISPVFAQMRYVNYLFTRNPETPQLDGVTIFSGLEYAIFNETCQFIQDEIYFRNLSREFLTIGVSMGGGDAPNKTLRILRSVCQLEMPCTFWVLLGEGYRHSYQDLVDSIRRDSNHEVILAKTNRSMWNVFSNCAVAIVAGGLTTLEAVYAGLPTLNIFDRIENLNATGRQIFEQGAAENIGFFNEESLERLRERLRYYNVNKSGLLQMREQSKGKVDKLGASRIYSRLEEILNGSQHQR